MFLSLLSPVQKTAFARIARWIIAADEVEDENEQWLMHLSQHAMGIDEWPVVPRSEMEFLDALKHFDNPISKNILLFEALCVALADGDLDPRESDVLAQIVRDRKMRAGKLEKFAPYAREYLDLIARGEDLITSR